MSRFRKLCLSGRAVNTGGTGGEYLNLGVKTGLHAGNRQMVGHRLASSRTSE